MAVEIILPGPISRWLWGNLFGSCHLMNRGINALIWLNSWNNVKDHIYQNSIPLSQQDISKIQQKKRFARDWNLYSNNTHKYLIYSLNYHGAKILDVILYFPSCSAASRQSQCLILGGAKLIAKILQEVEQLCVDLIYHNQKACNANTLRT